MLLPLLGAVATSHAQLQPARFDWTRYPIKVGNLEFGTTTYVEVLSKLLGPAAVHHGDGAVPHMLCYAQESNAGQLLRLNLSFFGAGDDASLSAIEIQTSVEPAKGNLKGECSEPKYGVLPLGLAEGVQLGDSRAATRRVLGAPNKRTPTRDEYKKTVDIPNGFLVTELRLIFDSKDRLKGLLIRQIRST